MGDAARLPRADSRGRTGETRGVSLSIENERARRREVERILAELRHGWSDTDVAELRMAERDLYDGHGLPR